MRKSAINRPNTTSPGQEAVSLLQQLIAIPSVSREETQVADFLQGYLQSAGFQVHRKGNNLWMYQAAWDDTKPVLLLNSHIDTVKPVAGYTRGPFDPHIENGKLYGLGSNDAGGPLVSLLAMFRAFYQEPLPYNLLFLASAEEEVSGQNGVSSVLPVLGDIDCALVGEPTQMQMAIAEKGLLVVDGYAYGKSGHAARNEGENALYKALSDIQKLQTLRFAQKSDLLGEVKLTVTGIEAGTQHNVVPDTCHYFVDIRPNEHYTNKEIFDFLNTHLVSELKPRSLRLNASSIPEPHPLVQAGKKLGLSTFGSPTLSDQALMPFPSMKIGPGNSARSHTADEFIAIREIEEGIGLFMDLLNE